jgi:type I restriction enzyme S subunit
VKEGWKTDVPMGTLCSIDSGKSNVQDAVDDAPYALFDRSKKIKRSTRYLFDCEALIIPGEGTEFLPRHFIGKFDLHQRAYALHSFSKNLDVKYLYYYLIHMKNYFPHVAVGATVKSLRRRHFENLPVVVAPCGEQQRIVAILDEAFAGLATATANAEKNLKNARELFESYLNLVFAKRGHGWADKSLEEVSTQFGRGKSKHRPRNDPTLYGGKFPFIQTGDIRNSDHLIIEYSQTYNDKGLAQSKLWPKGTICITIAANIAETGILAFDACFPDSVIGLVADPAKANNKFVEYLLQSFKAELQAHGKGSAQANINLATFENQTFPFPPVESQNEIVRKLDEITAEKQRLEILYKTKLNTIAELKQSILQKAFAGELTSPASSAIKEAAE